ncbi:MAG: hypothetical protein ACXW48_20225, partial [Candidatus Binatia bacterium]
MARIVAGTNRRFFLSGITRYGLLIFYFLLPFIPGGDTAAAEPTRLRISIPGLGSTSYPLIMAQKKGY